MSKILIIFPKLEPYKKWHYIPYSALCVASYWINNGAEVRIHDERIRQLELKDVNWTDNIMFTAYTGYQITDMYRLAKMIKKWNPYKNIILGGPHATLLPEQCLDDKNINAVICGYMETGEYDMPWELINIKNYINPATKRFMYLTSYGCPGHCTFCANKCKRQWVLLPMDKVEFDIDNLMNLYPFKECVMFDATIFTDKQRARQINRIMLKHDLTWIADARACELYSIDSDYLNEFTGLKQLTIGLESGSQKAIDVMQKGRNHLRIYKKVAAMMAKTNIRMVSGVVLGCPGETSEDLKQTIDYVLEIKRLNPNFFISSTFFRPLPETLMCDDAIKYGYKEPETLEEWANMGDSNHYQYNQWQESPWIQDVEEYKRIYDNFVAENSDIFI